MLFSTIWMAKRSTGVGTMKTSRSKKTKKRMAIKSAMITARKAKAKRK